MRFCIQNFHDGTCAINKVQHAVGKRVEFKFSADFILFTVCFLLVLEVSTNLPIEQFETFFAQQYCIAFDCLFRNVSNFVCCLTFFSSQKHSNGKRISTLRIHNTFSVLFDSRKNYFWTFCILYSILVDHFFYFKFWILISWEIYVFCWSLYYPHRKHSIQIENLWTYKKRFAKPKWKQGDISSNRNCQWGMLFSVYLFCFKYGKIANVNIISKRILCFSYCLFVEFLFFKFKSED